MSQSLKNKAIDVLLTVTTFEHAQRMLLCVLKERPSCIVNAAELLTTIDPPQKICMPVGDADVPTDDTTRDNCVLNYLRTHNKIAAIKWYRLMTGCGLKDAKDKVEEIQAKFGAEYGAKNYNHSFDLSSATLTLIRRIWDGGKQEGIKFLMASDSTISQGTAIATVERCMATFDMKF